SLQEEGAAISSFKLVEGGVFQEDGIIRLLEAPADLLQSEGAKRIFGSRCLADNLSDLKAQVAANQKGIELVLEMVDHYSLAMVQAYMGYVQERAESAVRKALKELAQGVAGATGKENTAIIQAEDFMDDGTPIILKVTIDCEKGSAVFDFSGTGLQVWGNTNAPLAVTKSAILYSLRCLIKEELPLNHGVLVPIKIKVEPGSLLDPDSEAAVVGGNVLTSQRVVDVILKAFGVAAASQGCMNNLTFGDQDFGYYETIGGGAGAGPTWPGQSGVHTHMTNTRITDPEILERRYPVLLRQFSLRQNSGGRGSFPGGEGLIRELEFLAPLNVAILSERRVYAPYGLAGGNPGARGENTFIRADGRKLNLGGKNEIKAKPGDRFCIKTPGGGGYGADCDFEELLRMRQTPAVQRKIKNARVGIAGAGGLGSNVAVALARIGVGELIVADFDFVEPSNLNRQHYFIDQIGLPKVLALQENIRRINPRIKFTAIAQKITPANLDVCFSGIDVMVEAFDDADQKALLISHFLSNFPQIPLVAASGMAGFAPSSTILTRKVAKNLYLCGDGVSEAHPEQGLLASRVGLVASHQANAVLRLLLGEEPE
ncbi:MAG: sulfur carrier protein ThiS adenylyltransferase ThiF, partial [Deltaproteobacteria bacterium]|nr:sulfur carrier protein ThiS adenylyltransferase ThiF [Deltaproteobacteria bacterium]